jgi:hypothetical protein
MRGSASGFESLIAQDFCERDLTHMRNQVVRISWRYPQRRRGAGTAVHKCEYALLALAALILAAAFVASPEGSAATERQWAPADIHLSGVYRNTAMLAEENFPPH